MGKFLKTCLIIGIICIVAGIAASSAGVSLGGLSEWKDQIIKGEWSIDAEDFLKDKELSLDENLLKDKEFVKEAEKLIEEFKNILPTEPIFELENQEFFEEGVTIHDTGDKQEYSFATADVQEIHIKSAGVTVEFMVHNGSEIIVYTEKLGKFQNSVKEGELKLIASGQSRKELGEGVVEVLIPESVCAAGNLDVEVEASASVIELGSLQLKEVDLEVSAGVIKWESLVAKDLGLDMVAGAVTGAATRISGETGVEMQAGSVELTGSLGVETELEIMAGEIRIGLTDAYEDYNYEVSCAGGSVTLGTEKISGVSKETRKNPGAGKKMEIDCAAGVVEIIKSSEQE